MLRIARFFFLFSFVAGWLLSCKTIAPTSEQALLVNNKIVCDSQQLDITPLWGFVKQKPNRRLLGLVRFNKWIYTKTNVENPNKVQAWLLRTAGEEPVYYDELLTNKSAQQMRLWLESKGYYHARVNFTTTFNKQKARVIYKVACDEPYRLQNIDYVITDTAISRIIAAHADQTILKQNALFDITDLEKEQTRIERLCQDNGYYDFSKDYISFAADTSLGQHKVALTVSLMPSFDSISQRNVPHQKYYINHTYIHINHRLLQTEELDNYDSLQASPTTTLFADGKMNLRSRPLLNLCYVKNKEEYHLSDAEKTQRRFLEMPLVKSATSSFKKTPHRDSAGRKALDCYIDLVQNKIHVWSFDLEETNTSGDWGTELKTTYTNRNIFRGFEKFQLRLRSLVENNRALGEDTKKLWVFNTVEYGVDASILFPTWISPFKSDRFDKAYTPQTNIAIGYSYQQIPYYTRPMLYFSYGYIWKGNRFLTHTFNPIELRGIRYINQSNYFKTYLDSRSYLAHSYEDYLISSTNYSFVYNQQDPNVVRNFKYVKINLESAGNILYAVSYLAKRQTYSGSYHILETQFAQYLKADVDFRYYIEWSQKTTTVCRWFSGVAVPYGNQNIIPNIKRYTAGGASSMRGWLSQSLGPGSFVDTSAIRYASGDMRLEANFEHRFPLFWMLNGAVFTDIGNVWSVSAADHRSGAQFSLSKFYNELAVDAGVGLRLDVSFFVLRTDLGVKLRNPANDVKWIIGNRFFHSNDFNLTFGIGYPF